jgi:hypothetical protein
LELEIFSPSFGRDGITRGDTVFDVKVCRFADVLQDLISCIALGDTARERRHAGDVSAVWLLLKDNRIAHRK